MKYLFNKKKKYLKVHKLRIIYEEQMLIIKPKFFILIHL